MLSMISKKQKKQKLMNCCPEESFRFQRDAVHFTHASVGAVAGDAFLHLSTAGPVRSSSVLVQLWPLFSKHYKCLASTHIAIWPRTPIDDQIQRQSGYFSAPDAIIHVDGFSHSRWPHAYNVQLCAAGIGILSRSLASATCDPTTNTASISNAASAVSTTATTARLS